MIHTQARALKNRTFEPYGHARVAVGGMMEGRGSFGGLLEWQKAPEPLAQPPYDAHTGPSPQKEKEKTQSGRKWWPAERHRRVGVGLGCLARSP